MRRKLTSCALALTIVIALAMPSVAGAQATGVGCTPPTSVYTPVPCVPEEPPRGGHPFTGFDAGLVGFVGLALFGTGFAMRRMTRLQD